LAKNLKNAMKLVQKVCTLRVWAIALKHGCTRQEYKRYPPLQIELAVKVIAATEPNQQTII
jgi:hypothetical protein